MANNNKENVTMRIRVGDSELEVTGPQEFVEKKIEKFVKELKQMPARARGGAGTAESTGIDKIPESQKRLSAAQFFKKLTSKSEIDRGLAAGYYLEKFKGEDNFTAADIRDTIKGAKISPPKNPSDVINKNIKKGFMMAAGNKDGKMAFVLTSDGEDAVLEIYSL